MRQAGRFRVLAIALLLGCTLAGCASRPASDVLTVTEGASVGTPVSILVATTRKRSNEQDDAFTIARSRTVNYEQYTISIPPNHKSGQIEFPQQGRRDPATNFVVTEAHELQPSGFRSEIARQKGRDVLVFVHGYNTNFQEALFRQAQLTYDAKPRGGAVGPISVLFAWPSAGALTGYVADRESSTYSRDYLEQVLNDIASIPDVRSVNIVAHSMGNWLAVETLRQARLRGKSAFLGKLGDVTLISPDIDVDVFRTQLDAIGRLKRPITIVLNKNDLALRASQRLAGDIPRVGNVLIDNPEAQAAIKKYDLRVVDLSQVKGGDSLNHSTFIQALPALQQIVESNALAGHGEEQGAGVFVVDAAGEVLSTPLRIGNALLGR